MSTPKRSAVPMDQSFRVIPSLDGPRDSCDPLGGYAETYWAPTLCPTAYVLGRRLVSLVIRHRDRGHTEHQILDPVKLAMALGIGRPAGRPELPVKLEVLERTMVRLEKYKLVYWRSEAVLEVRLRWPRLSHRSLSKLPAEMQLAEPEWWLLDGGPVAANTLNL